MKALLPLLAFVLLPATAMAQEPLDLKLPQGPVYAQDPPGTYYGDTSGVPLAPAGNSVVARNACGTPLDQDDGKAKVHGSVATGFGHTEGRGSSQWNAVNLNLCKAYTTDEGNTGAFNLNIGVSQYDGPRLGPGYGYGPGYGPAYFGVRRAPGDVGPPPPQSMGGARYR